ncbi:heat-shock protein [beta proteobacterium AAP99]|nr:heat-shock protein [beta proteobacterium AAP99]
MSLSTAFCAIDFGTSNSAVALPVADGVRLVQLEPGHDTMPTAVFYEAELGHGDGEGARFGRAAVAAYVEGHEGRLMRSMKSVLGSSLVEDTTAVGDRAYRYIDIISHYLRHLKQRAEREAGAPLGRVVLGRPVHFVDDDAQRDARAQQALESAARAVGFAEVGFQFEPIAAAFDHESRIEREELVLVADIGGGTSDFSLVRLSPARRARLDRSADILANHGVHIAGTDFDFRVELEAIARELGFKAAGPGGREVPSKTYFELATWHLINTLYAPLRMAEVKSLKSFYANPVHHERLMRVLQRHLGHALIGLAEGAKIEVAAGGETRIDLSVIEPELAVAFSADRLAQCIASDVERVVATGVDTVRRAGLTPDAVDALYFTGGSTGLTVLAQAIAAPFTKARSVYGEKFASVATGLGIHAARMFA